MCYNTLVNRDAPLPFFEYEEYILMPSLLICLGLLYRLVAAPFVWLTQAFTLQPGLVGEAYLTDRRATWFARFMCGLVVVQLAMVGFFNMMPTGAPYYYQHPSVSAMGMVPGTDALGAKPVSAPDDNLVDVKLPLDSPTSSTPSGLASPVSSTDAVPPTPTSSPAPRLVIPSAPTPSATPVPPTTPTSSPVPVEPTDEPTTPEQTPDPTAPTSQPPVTTYPADPTTDLVVSPTDVVSSTAPDTTDSEEIVQVAQ